MMSSLAKGVEVVTSSDGEVFDVELEVDILRENRRLADENKKLLQSKGIQTIDVMGSVGSGVLSQDIWHTSEVDFCWRFIV